jgi:hypothetical protein
LHFYAGCTVLLSAFPFLVETLFQQASEGAIDFHVNPKISWADLFIREQVVRRISPILQKHCAIMFDPPLLVCNLGFNVAMDNHVTIILYEPTDQQTRRHPESSGFFGQFGILLLFVVRACVRIGSANHQSTFVSRHETIFVQTSFHEI